MRFDVLLTEHAQHDLEELRDYIAEHDTPGNAARVLDRIIERRVYTCLIADGRRDMQTLLARRMLAG